MSRLMTSFLISPPWRTVYNDATAAAGAEGGGEGKGEGDGKGGEGGGDPGDEKPTISKTQMNKIVEERLAKEKKKSEEEKKKVIDQLTVLQNAKGIGDKEKGDLQTQIDDLKNSLLTKEQLAAQEKKKLETELTKKVQDADARAKKNWELYEKSTIHREITDAAVQHKAYRPSQIVKHLTDMTNLTEDKDPETGVALGTYTPKVKFPDVKDGKPITLDLTVGEAVKRMKDLPDEYGNFFISDVTGGLGGSGGTGGTGAGADDTPPTDAEKYRKWREKQKKAGKL